MPKAQKKSAEDTLFETLIAMLSMCVEKRDASETLASTMP
jgi:hypothetical protein